MPATQTNSSARRNATHKIRTRTSESCLDTLDHLDTVESLMLTVLRRMESEEDWRPEQTTLMVGIEYLKRVAHTVRHHVEIAAQSK